MADGAEKKVEKEGADTKGWLYKWTNYIKGYQKRWFVLQNGLLSYYRQTKHTGLNISQSLSEVRPANKGSNN